MSTTLMFYEIEMSLEESGLLDIFSSINQYIRPVQKVSSHVLLKIEIFTEENTRNSVHTTVMPQSPVK